MKLKRTAFLSKFHPLDYAKSPLLVYLVYERGTRYRRLFETAKDGIFLLDADTGRITDVNPFLEDLLGYSHTELIGKALWEIGPVRDIDASQEAVRNLQKLEYIRYENLPLQTKTGQQIQVEFVSNVYLVDRWRVIQCNVRDITARKQAEDGNVIGGRGLAAYRARENWPEASPLIP